jgi:pimeloyl-ACP methyl ester carboxylesterase
MERPISIQTPDKKTIHGLLRGSVRRPLIVQVHGIAGNLNEALHYNAAGYFERHGFSSFRFNLYSWQKRARKLHECTFRTHGRDIDTVLRYLQSRGAKNIFLVGHSYGLPSILHAELRTFLAAAAWDGSLLPTNHVDLPKRIQKPQGRLRDEGYLIVVGEEMARDSRRIKSLDLLKKWDKPISFITVNDNKDGNWKSAKRMHKAVKGAKELIVIRGAHHNFAEEGKQEKLYAATVRWFKRWI